MAAAAAMQGPVVPRVRPSDARPEIHTRSTPWPRTTTRPSATSWATPWTNLRQLAAAGQGAPRAGLTPMAAARTGSVATETGALETSRARTSCERQGPPAAAGGQRRGIGPGCGRLRRRLEPSLRASRCEEGPGRPVQLPAGGGNDASGEWRDGSASRAAGRAAAPGGVSV